MLKWLVRLIAVLAGVAVIGIGITWAYFFVVLPRDLPVPDIEIERTPERIARGEYLANAVFGCVYCHSERDWSLLGAPPKPGRIGAGGELFDESVGLSGMIVAPNITPYHLGDWSDGEIYRAIVNGLHKEGYAFFPIMPFDVYLHLNDEDIYSIIAYVRTLAPIEQDHPPRRPSMLMQLIANIRALPADPWDVDQNDPVSRGEYLARIAGCRFCHTPADERAQPLPGMWFAGGLSMPGPSGETAPSANITPDKETGIGNWTTERFIQRFKMYAGARIPVSEAGYQTQHAWTEYGQMTPADLADIYAYLMSQEPVRNDVDDLRQ